MTTYQVTVSQLSNTSSEKSINEFFSFCGRISTVEYEPTNHVAHIIFEKQQAAKTALMLNGGTLDGATIHVHSDTVTDEHSDERPMSAEGPDSTWEQHDKPKAGIVAELLAKGYVLSETILHKAIAIDQKQGISSRFISYIRGLDTSIGHKIGGPDTTVSSKAKETLASGQAQVQALNEQHGITRRAQTFDEQHGITRQATDYYSKAIASPFGQKVVAFYTTATKQVQDVHEEAMRIAQAEKEKQGLNVGGNSAAPGSLATEHTNITNPPATTSTVPGAAY